MLFVGESGLVGEHGAELGEGLVLNLADAFARAANLLADFLKRFRAFPVEPEAELQDQAFAFVELGEQREQTVYGFLVAEDAVGRHGPAVGDDVLEFALFALLNGIVERERAEIGEAQAGDGALA